MKDALVLRKNKDMVTRVIDDETILMPIYKTSDEINCIYTLNKTASFVWELIDGKHSMAKIKQAALDNFKTTEKEAEKELEGLIKDLKEIKAVK
jgi:methyltransferase-like protein